MDVRIVDFPETRVAVFEHRGPPHLEHETTAKLVAWRIANRRPPHLHRTYGLHYDDPRTTPPADYRMDLCITVDSPVAAEGVVDKVIPAGRCAVARHVGADGNMAALYLSETWLPASGEQLRVYPLIFHYVNAGPGVTEQDLIVDVYMPLV